MDKRIATTHCKNIAGPDQRLPGRMSSGMLVAAAVVAALSWAGPGAQAATLGAATVQSALGEPLRAEIQIPQLSSEEASTFSARMAPPEAFAGAGIQYNTHLAGARVSLERRAGGQAYLRITTDQPINDPVLGIVIQADWASGQITRDYTMLLDPPRHASIGTAQQETTAVPVPAPAPRAPRVSQAEQVRPAPAAVARRRSPRPETPRSSAPGTDGGSVTIRSGDTASEIAVAHGLQGVSLDQMLLAMLRTNPDAFIQGNVNLIRAGAVIRMPSAEEARTVSRADARRMVLAQTEDFKAYRSGLARNVQATQATPGNQAAEGQVEPQVAETEQPLREEDRLEVSKGGAGTEVAAQEAAQSRQSQDQVDRVAELDRNISELSELEQQLASESGAADDAASTSGDTASGPDGVTTETGSDDAASTADAAEGAESAGSAADDAPATPESATDSADLAADSDAGDTADAEAPTSDGDATGTDPTEPEASVAGEEEDAAVASSDADAEDGATAEQPAGETATTAAADSADAAGTGSGPAIAASVPVEQPSGVLDRIAEYRWPIVAILVALLALFGIGRSRRRKRDELLPDDESLSDGFFAGTGADAVAEQKTTRAGLPDDDESSLLGSASTAPDGQDNTTEELLSATFVDTAFPLTATESEAEAGTDLVKEADIYIEYGHDDKAENLLKRALQSEPGRAEIYEKLAGIHLRRKDRNALAALSAQAAAAPENAEAAWQAVAAVGRELEPNNPRYQARTSGATPATDSLQDALDDAETTRAPLGASFNHPTFWAETEKGGTEFMDEDDGTADHRYSPTTLDFDLDFDENDIGKRNAPVIRPELTAADLQKDTSGNAGSIERTPGTHEESLDLDIDFSASGSDADTPSSLMGFDLDSELAPAAPPVADSTLMDFDLDIPPLNEADAPATADTNEDSLATKLALAEEFEAIGDRESARTMADEVAQFASGVLKEQAEAFLKKLGEDR